MLKKIISLITMLLFSALLFSACVLSVPGGGREKPSPDALWTNDNTVYVQLKETPAMTSAKLADFIANISESAGIKEHYILEAYEGSVMQLLLVLSGSGDEAVSSAVAFLQAHPSVAYARAYGSVPFEAENTLKIAASPATVGVGETVTLKIEGGLRVYQQSFSFDQVIVSPKKQNLAKEYTPADFPQAEVAKVELAYILSGSASFTLTLAQNDYFNVIKAVDAFARDSAIASAYLNGWGFPDVYCSDRWEISDTSVADFSNKVPTWWDGDGTVLGYDVVPGADGAVTVKGLKVGKATVTYTPSRGWYLGTEYAVTCEITVTDHLSGVITGFDDARVREYRVNNDALVYRTGDAPWMGDGAVTVVSNREELLALHDATLHAAEEWWKTAPPDAPQAEAFALLTAATARYTEAFFETNQLAVIHFTTPYAAFDYVLQKVSWQNGMLVLTYKEVVPPGMDAVDAVCGFGAVALEFTRVSTDVKFGISFGGAAWPL
ncbi:MAG: hypothetical protein FWD58_07285 [Firmicutes bacterium]|nr:hypothetical protein [Bacillota bacterium]